MRRGRLSRALGAPGFRFAAALLGAYLASVPAWAAWRLTHAFGVPAGDAVAALYVPLAAALAGAVALAGATRGRAWGATALWLVAAGIPVVTGWSEARWPAALPWPVAMMLLGIAASWRLRLDAAAAAPAVAASSPGSGHDASPRVEARHSVDGGQ